MSNPFQTLMRESPEVGQAFGDFIKTLANQPALDAKVKQLIFIALQTAGRNPQAVAAHIPMARALGATRAEIVEAMLITLPASGIGGVMHCLPEVEKALGKEEVMA
jgi:alkylhydroperoxidase/carboxymuconolactone decarboxylase family protein YurZ